MFPFVRFSRLHLFFAAGLMIVLAASARAQTPAAPEPPDLSATYNEGVKAYGAGDYKTAVERFEAILKQVPPESQGQFEPLFYTLGAAYLKLDEYAKAIETFKTYQTKFPQSPKHADVQFAIAQAHLGAKNYAEAAKHFLALESIPKFHDQALLLAGQAYKEDAKPEEATRTLEKLVGPGIKSRYAEEAAILLMALYSGKQPDKARQMAQLADKNVGLVENIARMNALLLETGDTLLKENAPREALIFYRMGRRREEIIRFQTDRIAGLEAQVEKNLAAVRANPQAAAETLAANNEIKVQIEQSKALLAEFEKLPNFNAGLLLRQGQAFYGLDKKREATIVYRELLAKNPEAEEREPAQYALLVSLAELGKAKEAQIACDEYLKAFPKGPNVAAVGYLKGATALEAGDFAGAETFFGIALADQPQSEFRERMRLMLANAKFAQGKFPEARAEYLKYLEDFPKGSEAEEASYRATLALLFDGKFEEAMAALTAYLQQYPAGSYRADAKYRLGVCKYAASLYDEVIADCLAWETEFPDDPMMGENLALLADAYSATDKPKEATDTYIRAVKAATTDEVRAYAIMEAAKRLEKAGEWDRLSGMFEELVKERPEDPLVVSAAFWIAKARARQGKVEEAKVFIADTIKRYINDRERPAVEELVTQLAQLTAKKKRPAAPSGAAAPEPETDPLVELDTLLAGADNKAKPLARARLLFAKSEVQKFRKHPAEQEALLQEIATQFPPGELSAPLLAYVGDHLRGKNQPEKAAAYYQALKDDFAKTDFIDFAYCGLGELALAEGKNAEALRYFTSGLDDIAPASKLKDLTVGKARAQLALGQLDEAEKSFSQISSVREWRGDSTALAVYSLGEIEMKRGDWAKAIAYFQRVYVAYRRYLPWVAKSYLRSAECFEKLGKLPEAKNTYGEMLMNEKLKGMPETLEAEKKLKGMGQS